MTAQFTLTPESLFACKEIVAADHRILPQIIDAVARETGISAKAICSRSRIPNVVRARWIVMYEAHLHGISMSKIGRALGRDHTTVMHGIRAEEQRRAQ